MPRYEKLILETDGASRGNPGMAGLGVIIRDDHGAEVATIGKFLGVSTNNQAEYQALIEGLTAVARYNPQTVIVRSDSELMVRQMNGQYRVRHPDLIPLYSRAVELAGAIPHITFEHVLRHRNKGADQVANVAIDSRGQRTRP
jgi:ribonuclease HI